ncbi:MAG: hypothetical protein RLZZ136_128 [Pseudomonadota bacterium]|jgi:MFS family permease
MPLLMLLLPRRVSTIAPDHALTTLSGLLLLGGLTASIAHIVSGSASDIWYARYGSRRGVLVAGIIALVGAYGLLAKATTAGALAIGMVCFQLSLNLLLAPLSALMADYVPDLRKGRIAGWLNAGLPFSILIVTALAHYAPNDSVAGFMFVAAAAAALITPLLLFWPFASHKGRSNIIASNPLNADNPIDCRDIAITASARLLVQMGAALMINYIFIFIASLQKSAHISDLPDTTTAVSILAIVASGAAITSSIVVGHLSDASQRRRIPMILSALAAAGALGLASHPWSWLFLIIAYAIFHGALAAYLAIDTALITQLVAGHPKRGTYLGLINLSNTLPAIISPILALASHLFAPAEIGLPRLMLSCALSTMMSAILVTRIRSIQ